MSNQQLRKPLFQAGLVLTICIFILSVGSTNHSGFLGGIETVFSGIFTTFIFSLGLTMGVLIAIATLIAIFFAAMALYSPEAATSTYKGLKGRLAEIIEDGSDYLVCRFTERPRSEKIDKKELDQLKQSVYRLDAEKEIARKNASSARAELEGQKAKLAECDKQINLLEKQQNQTSELIQENKSLAAKVANLEQQLTEKESSHNTDELLEEKKLLEEVVQELENKVKELEAGLNNSPEAAIFSYIKDKKKKLLLAEKVKEAVGKDMTYAQIDGFLAKELPGDLAKILKEHPSLTTMYIRNIRRESA